MNAEQKAREFPEAEEPYVALEYPIVIQHGYKGKMVFEGHKMYVYTSSRALHWAVYPEQWGQFSNGKGYEENAGK